MFKFLIDKICIALRSRPKLQSSHYQNKHLTRMLFEKYSLLLWSIMPNFCCAFGCSNKRKTCSKSNVSYYRIPFGTDPEMLSLRKRWIAAISRKRWKAAKRKFDRQSNWQLKNMQQPFIIGKSKKTLMVSGSLVFSFVSVAF